ncbi:MAG: glycine cleavage T C-terminal barrel domain-containing protein [Candidatus Kapaibacterium sp.]
MTSLTGTLLAGYTAAKHAVVFAFPDAAVLRSRGADRIDLLNRLSTNELKNLQPQQGALTVLTNEKGRIIDVLTVLTDTDKTLLLCSPGNQSSVIQWLRKYTIMDDCKVHDATAEYFALEIHGPESTSLLSSLAGEVILDLPMSHWQNIMLFGQPAKLIRQPAFCEFSFLVLFDAGSEAIVRAHCAEYAESVPSINSDVLEVLRIEAGSGKYGAELTDAYNPLEAGLLHMVHFKKGCYIGQEVIARIDSYNKVKQRIMGFVSQEVLTPGADITVDDGTTIVGRITSVTHSPDYGCIALGYIRGEHAHQHSMVNIIGPTSHLPAEIRQLPFE